MKHQDYCCDDSTREAYEQYYTGQAGSGLPGFQGLQYQIGHGLGSLFRGLVGVAAPLLKKGAIALGKSLGQKALKADLNWHKITWEIIKGTATKESASFHREQSGPRWQSGNTLASHLCGRGSIPVMAVSGKAGSCLPLVGSLQYRTLANYMYWFPLPFQLPVVI